MSFISGTFAIFFIIFAIVYHAIPLLHKNASRIQRIVLLAGSIVFYAAADFRFLPFLCYTIMLTWGSGLLCKKRAACIAAVVLELLPLMFIKYAGENIRFFPLGISFFTFQGISYVVDAYKGKISAEHNLLTVAQFISFFPTIASGPIQRASDLMPQLKEVHRFSYTNATDGMKLFAWGMFKKLCIADRIAAYVNFIYGNASEQTGAALLLATGLYAFQIYCDFSGYSDMATGIARYLGFDAGKNFDHPYLAASTGDFWRRWHISLSSWLRDYVYIPLGGSRVPLPRICLNLLATFLVSGLWHGLSWNFVIWGCLHGLYQCAGRITKERFHRIQIPAPVQIIITFCLITFAWIFFRAKNLSEAMLVISRIAQTPADIAAFFSMMQENGLQEALYSMFCMQGPESGGILGMAATILLILGFSSVSVMTRRKNGLERVHALPVSLRWAAYIVLGTILLYAIPLYGSTNVEFLYFAF